VSGFVSYYTTQAALVIGHRVSENQILRKIRFIDKDIIGRKNGVALTEGVAPEIETEHRIKAKALE